MAIHLFPELVPYLESPGTSMFKFALRLLVDFRMTSSYIRAGYCSQLVKLTLHPNDAVRELVSTVLYRLLRSDKATRKLPACAILPHLKDMPERAGDLFVAKALPLIISDFMEENYGYLWPILFHEKAWIYRRR
jgi:hypothetical protein